MNAVYLDGDIIYVDNFAEITDGVVTNLVWIAETNADEFPHCVRIGDRPVAIGDTCDGTYFYHNGEIVFNKEERLMDAKQALTILGVTES